MEGLPSRPTDTSPCAQPHLQGPRHNHLQWERERPSVGKPLSLSPSVWGLRGGEGHGGKQGRLVFLETGLQSQARHFRWELRQRKGVCQDRTEGGWVSAATQREPPAANAMRTDIDEPRRGAPGLCV